MNTPLVAVADSVFPSLEPAQQILAQLNATLRLASAATPEAILAVARRADALMVTYAKISGDIIQQLERCQIIARFGIGIDNIDVDAASQAGIVVTYVADYCIDEVSDHALALVDTFGVTSPHAMQYFVRRVKERFDTRLEAHFHMDFGMGVANTVMALAEGVEVVHSTVLGIGERAGNVPLEETVMGLLTMYGLDLGLNYAKLLER